MLFKSLILPFRLTQKLKLAFPKMSWIAYLLTTVGGKNNTVSIIFSIQRIVIDV